MSELGDTFQAWKQEKQAKRRSSLKSTLALLDARGIVYERLSEHHLRIGEYDFWPSTGLWISRTEKRNKGRGAIGLLRKLEPPKRAST